MFSTSDTSSEATSSATKTGVAAQESPRTSRRGFVTTLAVFAMLTGFCGCSTLHNGFEAISSNGEWHEMVSVLRNRSYSAKAWHKRKHHFRKHLYIHDLCAGFRAGYEAVANGEGECTPAFAPQKYWSWEYQSAEGQMRTAAWFEGFPHGCRAAEEDGANNWTQLQMSSGLQAQYQQTGMLQHEGALYPIPNTAPPAYPGIPSPDALIPLDAELVPAPPIEATQSIPLTSPQT
jgi:hypothetical protein